MFTLGFGVLVVSALASFFDRELRRTRRPESVAGIAPLVIGGLMAAKGLSKLMGGMGANKAAQASADNQNAENKWKAKLSGAQYATEQMPYRKQGSKMRGWRDAFMRGVMRNPNNGLSKLFGGWDEGKSTAFNAGQDVAQVQNPYDVAGAPPELKAVKGGWASTLGGAIGGAADAYVQAKSIPS